uniref:Uncharacterized protein n=1 Tax=Anguilla anguilla TaxID=7936 RepID=A0A0E9RJW2_ANGAN
MAPHISESKLVPSLLSKRAPFMLFSPKGLLSPCHCPQIRTVELSASPSQPFHYKK